MIGYPYRSIVYGESLMKRAERQPWGKEIETPEPAILVSKRGCNIGLGWLNCDIP